MEIKTVGLIGGTTWVSTLEYYRSINEITNVRLGGLNASKCIIHSFNFDEIASLQRNNETETLYNKIENAAKNLIYSGVSCIALCANTMHIYAKRLSQHISVPLIHIAEATAKTINKAGITEVGLLGTRYTMEMDFYTSVLKKYNISVHIPPKAKQDFIHNCIFDELAKDIFTDDSRNHFIEIINRLKIEGAEGIILGCTEIPLLVKQHHVDLPLFDTLKIHANAIVDFALSENENLMHN